MTENLIFLMYVLVMSFPTLMVVYLLLTKKPDECKHCQFPRLNNPDIEGSDCILCGKEV
jgi:hypothetical protein